VKKQCKVPRSITLHLSWCEDCPLQVALDSWRSERSMHPARGPQMYKGCRAIRACQARHLGMWVPLRVSRACRGRSAGPCRAAWECNRKLRGSSRRLRLGVQQGKHCCSLIPSSPPPRLRSLPKAYQSSFIPSDRQPHSGAKLRKCHRSPPLSWQQPRPRAQPRKRCRRPLPPSLQPHPQVPSRMCRHSLPP